MWWTQETHSGGVLVTSPSCCVCFQQETLHKSTDLESGFVWASEELCSWIQMKRSLWKELSASEAPWQPGMPSAISQTSHKEAVSNRWCAWKQLAAEQTADSSEERERDQTESMWELCRSRERVLKRGVTWWSLESTVRKPNRNWLHSWTGKECSSYRKGNCIICFWIKTSRL